MDKLRALLEKDNVNPDLFKEVCVSVERSIKKLKENSEQTENTESSNEPSTETTEAPSTEPTTANTEGLGIPYPSAPDSVDIFGGVTFAVLKDTTATVFTDGKVYELSSAEDKEIGSVKKGDKVKVLAIGTNDFARIEFNNGKVGFIKSTFLKQD